MAQRKLRILLRCMPGMHHRVCQQAIFVLVQSQLGKFAGLLGLRCERNCAKELLRNRCHGLRLRTRTCGGLLGDRCGSLRPPSGREQRRENQKEDGRQETIHDQIPHVFEGEECVLSETLARRRETQILAVRTCAQMVKKGRLLVHIRRGGARLDTMNEMGACH